MQLQYGSSDTYIYGDGTDLYVVSNNVLNLDSTSTLSINSSGGAINLGNDDVNYNINIGNNGERTVTIGSSDATALNLNATDITLTSVDDFTLTDGTATLLFDGSGADSLSGTTTLDLDTTSTISINSSGGVINLGNDDNDYNINIGNDGDRTITIGSTDSSQINLNATSIDMQSSEDIDIDCIDTTGTYGINIGTSTSGVPIYIGHSVSKTTVNDNLVVSG